MIVYIDSAEVPNASACEIPNDVLRYIISKAEKYEKRCAMLYNRYKGAPQLDKKHPESDEIKVEANYAKYIVDITKGYYLSEPVKYDNNDKKSTESKKKEKASSLTMVSSIEAKLDKDTGKLMRHDISQGVFEKEIDISPIIDCYHEQNIAEKDEENGKNIGIFGESCELLYASTDETPSPRSAVYPPDQLILVQDDTVEHRDLFGLWFEKCESIDNTKYYRVSVYSEIARRDYKSTDCSKDDFMFNPVGEPVQQAFGEVPIICYENNRERQGDFEQVISLIDARNELLSHRLTDKKNFVNALLALYGAILSEEALKSVKEDKFLDGLPNDAKMEYIQKTFDESSLKILDDTLVSEIHKMTLTPDMTDEKFSGNASGVALKLKLLALNILVKSKMRSMEKGLKKRWKLYNNFLSKASSITPVDIKDVDIVFTICMPIDEPTIVNMVCQLKNAGLVDDQTLLSLLWFVKDPAEALENMKQQKQESLKQYRDSFGNNSEDSDAPDNEDIDDE